MSLLTACAATDPKKIPINPDMATVIAYSNSVGNVLVPLSTSTSTKIVGINGKKVGDFFNPVETVELEQGSHELIISCHVIHGAINVSDKTKHVVELIKGKKYVFKASLSKNRSCTSTYESI